MKKNNYLFIKIIWFITICLYSYFAYVYVSRNILGNDQASANALVMLYLLPCMTLSFIIAKNTSLFNAIFKSGYHLWNFNLTVSSTIIVFSQAFSFDRIYEYSFFRTIYPSLKIFWIIFFLGLMCLSTVVLINDADTKQDIALYVLTKRFREGEINLKHKLYTIGEWSPPLLLFLYFILQQSRFDYFMQMEDFTINTIYDNIVKFMDIGVMVCIPMWIFVFLVVCKNKGFKTAIKRRMVTKYAFISVAIISAIAILQRLFIGQIMQYLNEQSFLLYLLVITIGGIIAIISMIIWLIIIAIIDSNKFAL